MKINVIKQIVKELNKSEELIKNVIALIQEGNTSTFIARYRANQVGNITGQKIEEIWGRYNYIINLEDRKNYWRDKLKEVEVYNEEVEENIKKFEVIAHIDRYCEVLIPEEDSLQTIARKNNLEEYCEKLFKSETEKEVEETINSIPEVEEYDKVSLVYSLIEEKLLLENKVNDYIVREKGKYKLKVGERINSPKVVKPHQILAERRRKGNIDVIIDEKAKEKYVNVNPKGVKPVAEKVYNDIEREYKKEWKKEIMDMAEERAIKVFEINLRELLLTRGIKNKTIMAIDPGYKNGCKIAVINEQGKPMHGEVLHLGKLEKVYYICKTLDVDVIAIGNGTGTNETWKEINSLMCEYKMEIKMTIVDECGASIYSTSKLALEEFGDLEPGIISAISLARRVQNPIAELVKVPVESLGVGQYQHDVSVVKLRESLKKVISDVVNQIGVDINTASYHLLSYVNGLNMRSAKSIINKRNEIGKYDNINQLKDVPYVSENVFKQSAGFLRVFGGSEPLDETGIHPYDYEKVKEYLHRKQA